MPEKKFANGETLRRVVFALLFCGCISLWKGCDKNKSASDIPKKASADTAQEYNSDF